MSSRRHFLRLLGLSTAAATLGGRAWAHSAEPMNKAAADRRPGFAVVGLGKYATEQILPNFRHCQTARLAALVSGDRAKAERLAREYGVPNAGVYTYDTFDSIRDNPDVEVVYIILPNGLHCEYTERAARAGKHVLCEKPMAVSVAECERMIAACRKADRQLMIGYRAQSEPFNLNAIERIRKGELGKVVAITSDHGRPVKPTEDRADTWRVQKKLAGGGSLMDIGIYALNAARYLTGEEPVEITAQVSSDPKDPRFKEVEDNVHFTLRFPSGVLASCTSSYSYEGVKRFRVFGQQAWLDLDPATDYHEHQMKIGRPQGTEEPKLREGNQFAAQLDHMAECVVHNRPPKSPGEEGLRDVRLMMAIYEAAQKGRAVKV